VRACLWTVECECDCGVESSRRSLVRFEGENKKVPRRVGLHVIVKARTLAFYLRDLGLDPLH
jgi:hypothetical protein